MEQPLPYGGFRWLRNCENFDVFANQNPKIGYVLEVDLEIPTSLHEYFKDLPPLLSHEAVGGGKKLLGTLYNQEKYTIHAENLKFV